MSLRTLIYARVSTEDQVEKYGLPVQFRACREYAAARGWTILESIADEGISGVVLDRPGLNRLRAIVARGEADVVLVLDPDRLSRELLHLLQLKPEIERRAVLEFVSGRFEDSPLGRLFFAIKGAVGGFEREQTRERLMRGKKERARTGLIVGGRTAYGYRYSEGKLTPDEERAPIVRDLFAWYDDSGLSMRQITLKLRAAGAPTWAGRTWGHSSVRRILVNETYAGVAHYGTHRREGKLLRARKAGEGERIALTVPALVSREQWDRVQARMATNPQRGRRSRKYLLTGLLYCAACGMRMCGDHGKGSIAYRCLGRDSIRHSERPLCRVRVKVQALDQAVWAAVTNAFTDAAALRRLLKHHEKSLRSTGPERAPVLIASIAKLKRKEDACVASLLDPDLADSRVAIKAEYARVKAERSRLEQELVSIERAKGTSISAGAWLEDAVALLREYVPTIESVEDRQAFLRGAVQRAEWQEGEVKIECLFSGELATTSARCEQFPALRFIVNARVAA
jgi:site-specific DNA recombinase